MVEASGFRSRVQASEKYSQTPASKPKHVHARGARPAREEAEDARARAEIDDDVARSDRCRDGALEGGQAAGIAEILTVLVEDQRHGVPPSAVRIQSSSPQMVQSGQTRAE